MPNVEVRNGASPQPCVTVNTLLFHLMLRHGVNALADSILDGVESAAGSLVRVTATTLARIGDGLSPRRVRTLGDSSHARATA